MPRNAARPAAPALRNRLGFGDYEVRGGRVYLRKTGNSAPLDRALLAEIAIWLAYQFVVHARGALRRLTPGRKPAIWFTPDVPARRYMVRAACLWAGIRVSPTPNGADAAFFFEDATSSPSLPAPALRHFNFACTDITKSRVAALWAAAAGYPLRIDPLTWQSEAVEKSERNGAHDGVVVRCPRMPVPGRTYQRLIDTVDADGYAVDLRTHCVGGRAVIVWVKRRDPERRFLPPNLSAEMHAPADIFSAAELTLIERFVALIGADWCALDVLRDRDRRIYVVDVNKTDAGPIVALPMAQKLASTAILARALTALVGMDPRPPTATGRST